MYQSKMNCFRSPVLPNWVFLILVSGCLGGLFYGVVNRQPTPAYGQSCQAFPNPTARFGYNVALDNGHTIDSYDVAALNGHWYLDYFTQLVPSQPAGMRYAQMIRPPFWRQTTMTNTVEAILANNPGTLWIVGNEPDRDKQDGLTPTEFATFYHDVYTFLKARDPESRVAIGGVVQSTPLRRRYLDMVLSAYQSQYGEKLPTDVWTVHAFILREDDQWGAWIPPGLEDFADEGMLYDVWDHDDLDIFAENIVAFRQWMADNGYRDKPLIVTEYGILLPDIGFPYPAVRDFMIGTFDFFLTAQDDQVGYPADNNLLVQNWSWFSLNYPPFDANTGFGHNGNLVEPNSGLYLELGRDYAAYVAAQQAKNQLQLGIANSILDPAVIVIAEDTPGGTIPSLPATTVISGTEMPTLTLSGNIHNQGTTAGCNFRIKLWHTDIDGTTSLVTATQMAEVAAGDKQPFAFTWQPQQLAVGAHELRLEIGADNADIGLAAATHDTRFTLLVMEQANAHFGFLPIIGK